MTEYFGRYFVWAMGLTLAYILIVGHWQKSQRGNFVDPIVLEKLPVSWVDPMVARPRDAKRKHLFWVSRKGDISGTGVAIDVLGHPELFKKVFPGYPPEMAADTELWNRYFQSEFDPTTHYAFFGEYYPVGLMLHHSWTGCFDIVEKYGADVVIMGSSETYRSVMPDLLGDLLASSGKPEWQGKRVLVCSVSRMLLPAQEATVARLKALLRERQIDALVWGFSFWTLYQRSDKYLATAAAQNRQFEKYMDQHEPGKPKSSFAKVFAHPVAQISLAHWVGRPVWEDLFPFRPFSFSYRPLGKALYRLDLRELWDQLHFRSPRQNSAALPPISEGAYVPVSLVQHPVGLATRLEKQTPYFGFLEDVAPEDCLTGPLSLTSKAVGIFREVGRQSRGLAQKGVLFIPPTTPLQTEAAPRCLFELVQSEVAAQASPKTHTLNGRWETWGVNYADFLYPTADPETLRLDIFHVNQSGATRVTHRLSEALTR